MHGVTSSVVLAWRDAEFSSRPSTATLEVVMRPSCRIGCDTKQDVEMKTSKANNGTTEQHCYRRSCFRADLHHGLLNRDLHLAKRSLLCYRRGVVREFADRLDKKWSSFFLGWREQEVVAQEVDDRGPGFLQARSRWSSLGFLLLFLEQSCSGVDGIRKFIRCHHAL